MTGEPISLPTPTDEHSAVAATSPPGPASAASPLLHIQDLSDRTRALAGVEAIAPFSAEGRRSIETYELKEQGKDEAELAEPEREEVKGWRLVLLLAALLLVEVLVGLDNTIVATSTATIANEFKALTDVGWYGSAYLLTSVAFQPLAGRAYQFFPQKWVFLVGLSIFLVGNVVAGVAQSSMVLILGRAIQGLGYAFLFIGILAITANTLPVRSLSIVTSLMNASYGTGTVLGPLIGGAFTSKVSWRWCFYVALPPGGLALGLIVFFLNPPRIPQTLSVRERLYRMDWGGAVLLLGSLICLLIALQEGGITSPWGSSKVIGLLVGFGLILAAFFALQYALGEKSSISMRLLLRNRSMAACTLLNWTCGATYFAALYYVPIFFQTVQGSSPVRAGLQTLPLILLNMSSGIAAGWFVKHFGVVHPPMIVATIFTALGAGLHASMDTETTDGQWIGYGIVIGIGMGAFYMLSFLYTQMALPDADKSKGASLVCWSQIFGATIWVSASSALYANKFKHGIEKVDGVDVQAVLDSGVDRFREVVTAEQLPAVVDVSVDALWHVFLAIAMIAVIGFLSVFAIKWVSLGKADPQKQVAKKKDEEAK
ncbi:hypothetical protein JCM11251_001092 [Rhodosporidiobolus azoricus]